MNNWAAGICAVGAGLAPLSGILPPWGEMALSSLLAVGCYLGGRKQGQKILASQGLSAGKISRVK